MRMRSLRPNRGGSNCVWSSGITTGRRMKMRKKVDDKHDRRRSLGRDGGWRAVDIKRVSSNPSSCDSMGEVSPCSVERYPDIVVDGQALLICCAGNNSALALGEPTRPESEHGAWMITQAQVTLNRNGAYNHTEVKKQSMCSVSDSIAGIHETTTSAQREITEIIYSSPSSSALWQIVSKLIAYLNHRIIRTYAML